MCIPQGKDNKQNNEKRNNAMCDYPNPLTLNPSPRAGEGTLRNLAPLLLPWEKGLGDVARFPQGGLTLVAHQVK
jgi:hypothetical protein